MSELRASLRCWLHSLWCMWRGNLRYDGWDIAGARVVIACTCGRVFWLREAS